MRSQLHFKLCEERRIVTARKFCEFEAYAAAIGNADVRMMLPRLKRRQWELSTFFVDRLHLQFGVEGGGVIAEGVSPPDGRLLYVPLTGGQRANGIRLGHDSIFVVDPQSAFTISVLEEHRWCSILVPRDACRQDAEDESCASGARVIPLGRAAVAEIRQLLNRLHYAEGSEQHAKEAALAVAREELVWFCRQCEARQPAPAPATGRPLLVRSELARTVRDLIEYRGDEGVTIEELARAADVSERTLRTLFLEYFGVPPRRFLLIWRLNQVRAALCSAVADEMTVTSIAAQYGFWHLGRFAGAYGKLFGETPSATLQQGRRRQQASYV